MDGFNCGPIAYLKVMELFGMVTIPHPQDFYENTIIIAKLLWVTGRNCLSTEIATSFSCLRQNQWRRANTPMMTLLMKMKMVNIAPMCNGPKGCPNNLPQPAWCLTELFFWSDLSWSWADLCANSYVISTRFSLLSTMTSCTLYISNIGSKTGLNSFQDFPYVTTFLLRSISVFYLWKTEQFRKELGPSATVIFGPRNFGKRSVTLIIWNFHYT